MMYHVLLVISICFALCGGASFAQVPDRLIYDTQQSEHFGAENIITIHRMLYKQQDSLMPAKLWEEARPGRKLFGMGYRAVKLGLLDFQVDYLAALAQHEVFGHGSRYREQGFTKSSYSLNLGFPFGSGSGFAKSGTPQPGRIYTRHEAITRGFGGNEANIVLSEKIVPRMLSKNKIHYREALLYLISKNNLLAYIWVDKLSQNGTFGGGDIATYVIDINIINGASGKFYTLDKLAKQSLVSLLNPVQLYSAFAIGKTYVIDGNTTMSKIPAIRIKNIRYLPTVGYNLTPFGSEYVLDNFFIADKRVMNVNASVGDNTFHSFWSAGVKVYNLVNGSKVLLSADAKLWHQPSMDLGGRTVEHTRDGLGFKADADVSWFPFPKARSFGLFAQLGYKTDGYVLGEQLGDGMILRFGASLRAD